MTQTMVYEKKIIAYLDVLGFADIVKENHPDAAIPRNILELFHDVLITLKDDKYIGHFFEQFKYRFFSDTIVITLPLRRNSSASHLDSLIAIIWLVIHSHLYLIKKGIIFRGALHIGSIYDKGNYIFGTGFQVVHDLEKSDAVYPIVIISDELMDYIEEYSNNHEDNSLYNIEIKPYIAHENHAFNYIDYLKHENYNSKKEYLEFICEHRKLIVAELERHKDNSWILQKYKWLSRYHDKHVSNWQRGIPDNKINDYLINIKFIGNSTHKNS